MKNIDVTGIEIQSFLIIHKEYFENDMHKSLSISPQWVDRSAKGFFTLLWMHFFVRNAKMIQLLSGLCIEQNKHIWHDLYQ